jgi:ribose 5-phosphate isomerase B
LKLFIGADHAGFALKEALRKKFSNRLDLVDLGTDTEESCDYPDIAKELCLNVLKNPKSLGLLICGSGIGMAIAANKIAGIRAACVSEPISAGLARQHNDAQVLCLGARIISEDRAVECLEAFLRQTFDVQHHRHQLRIDKISKLEKNS